MGNQNNPNPFAKVFSEIGGVDTIENLLSRADELSISNKCHKILETYFINTEIKSLSVVNDLTKKYMGVH
jgi:hypothetical protein